MNKHREELLIENALMSAMHNKLWLTDWNSKNHLNLSMTEVSILEILHAEGPKRAKELSEPLHITSGGITGICNRLIKKGYIVRTRDESIDRRSVVVHITDLGRQVVQQAFEMRLELVTNHFSELTDEEIKIWNKIYKKLIHHILEKKGRGNSEKS
ncbi:MarR family transcriptional regulator [Shouchella clausii]|uniref:MarR family winged helix-turn-helix transcriptional regulator n=1 Tax=Shouchella clausii TaxID=79880 RepID=UPI0039838419